MQIKGYAFDSNREEVMAKYKKRYNEIKHLNETIRLGKKPQYAHTKFSGTLATDEEKQLSELDIALIADHGNLCFGGECTKSGDKFWGSYNTD